MFVILSCNLLSFIEDTLQVKCLSKLRCIASCGEDIWMRMRRAGHEQKNTYIYGHGHRYVHYNVHDQLHLQRDAPDRQFMSMS